MRLHVVFAVQLLAAGNGDVALPKATNVASSEIEAEKISKKLWGAEQD